MGMLSLPMVVCVPASRGVGTYLNPGSSGLSSHGLRQAQLREVRVKIRVIK